MTDPHATPDRAANERNLPPHDPSAHENNDGPEFFSFAKWFVAKYRDAMARLGDD